MRHTSFFHARASHRCHNNHIQELDLGTEVVVLHDMKAATLHAFYKLLLGEEHTTS